MICLTHPTLVVRCQPLVRFPFVVEYPGEVAVWPVSPYGATRGLIVTASVDIAGDAAGGILTTVGAPDDLGLIRTRRHAYQELTRTRPSTSTNRYYEHMAIERRYLAVLITESMSSIATSTRRTDVNRAPRRHVNTALSHVAILRRWRRVRGAPEAKELVRSLPAINRPTNRDRPTVV